MKKLLRLVQSAHTVICYYVLFIGVVWPWGSHKVGHLYGLDVFSKALRAASWNDLLCVDERHFDLEGYCAALCDWYIQGLPGGEQFGWLGESSEACEDGRPPAGPVSHAKAIDWRIRWAFQVRPCSYSLGIELICHCEFGGGFWRSVVFEVTVCWVIDVCSKEGLGVLVEYNTKKVFEVKLKELRTTMTDQIAENVNVNEVIEMVKAKRKEATLPDVDVVRTIWDAIMDAVQWSGKNQQQNSNLALRQVRWFINLSVLGHLSWSLSFPGIDCVTHFTWVIHRCHWSANEIKCSDLLSICVDRSSNGASFWVRFALLLGWRWTWCTKSRFTATRMPSWWSYFLRSSEHCMIRMSWQRTQFWTGSRKGPIPRAGGWCDLAVQGSQCGGLLLFRFLSYNLHMNLSLKLMYMSFVTDKPLWRDLSRLWNGWRKRKRRSNFKFTLGRWIVGSHCLGVVLCLHKQEKFVLWPCYGGYGNLWESFVAVLLCSVCTWTCCVSLYLMGILFNGTQDYRQCRSVTTYGACTVIWCDHTLYVLMNGVFVLDDVSVVFACS